MTAPPAAGRDDTVEAVLGPTNTGKTHYAVERMLMHASGVIGFPLRLLAREIYDRVAQRRGRASVALLTGEEKITPPTAQFYICTVEAMPLDWGADFIAVDEIQLCADPDRGHVFTDRLLRARGRKETLFLGAETMRGPISALLPGARITTRPRLSTLSYTGPKKISRLPARSAIVAFSTDQVYSIAELIRRRKGGAAIVMGALSPRTRNAQVAMFQNGDVEHLVATDAIGMGLNLDLAHVAFAGLTKFDGRHARRLTPAEIAQIAGRAGRHTADGTFGVTGDAAPLDDATALAVTEHRFRPVATLEWRNAALEFGTVPALIAALEAPAPIPGLRRAREADDLIALRTLWADPETRDITRGGGAVRRLWDCCQLPDFRKVAPAEHAALIGRIYRFLRSKDGAIPSDWIAAEIARLDRTEGGIDALSRRLAHMRTWSYVANRGGWMAEPGEWRGRAREVEDRLSDALHLALTREFVDRRTSVLMRRLKQKEGLLAEVTETGDVTAEGEHLGRVDGFRFIADPGADAEERKRLRAASLGALQGWFAHRVDKLYNAPDTEIDVTEQGGLMWGEVAVGRLEPGADALSPSVRAFADETLDPALVQKIERRLSHWVDRRIALLFAPLVALRDDESLKGMARGVAFQLVEGLGVLERRPIAEDVKALDQDARTLLRKHGVRFGQHSVFMPLLLKPAPTRLRLVLWGLKEKLEEIPPAPPPGLVTIPASDDAPEGFYIRSGYRRAGARAIRIDMLERLADMLRERDARAGFEATADMLSITGLTLEQFADLMRGLGFIVEKGERAKPPKTAPADAAASADIPPPPAPEAPPAAAAEPAEAAAPQPQPQSQPGAEAEATPPDAAEPAPAEPEQARAEPEPAEAEPAEAAKSAAPAADAPAPEMEVFYVFTTARRPPRGAKRQEAQPRRPQKKRGKPNSGGDRADAPKEKAGAAAGGRKPRPERAPDPDSPFAILKTLKR